MDSVAIRVEEKDPLFEAHPIEAMLQKACDHSEIIREILNRHGESTLAEYLQRVFTHAPIALQPRSDVSEAVVRLSEPVVGRDLAEAAGADIEKDPIAMTANHHGVDFFAQSVQGGLLFALGKKLHCERTRTALVLACGNIPLDNITYPQGLLIYRLPRPSIGTAPMRLPLFSNSLRRWIVSTSPGFDDAMVNRALSRVGHLAASGAISQETGTHLTGVLRDGYALGKNATPLSYSDQAVVVNRWIWGRMFPEPDVIPELICLELEKVTSHLLDQDLDDTASLAWNVFFHPRLRNHVLHALDGHQACWTTGSPRDKKTGAEPPDSAFKGTHFFWGISEKGRKFPLRLRSETHGEVVLTGEDNGGRRVRYPFSSESLKALIRRGRILPSIFTCFLEISFARGIGCIGGYYQAAYLPKMLAGVLRALDQTQGFGAWIRILQQLPTTAYLSGMQAVMAEIDGRHLVPAGPLEIMERKGIGPGDLETIAALTVWEAHAGSLFETIPDIAPWEADRPNWKETIAADCHRRLGSRLIIR